MHSTVNLRPGAEIDHLQPKVATSSMVGGVCAGEVWGRLLVAGSLKQPQAAERVIDVMPEQGWVPGRRRPVAGPCGAGPRPGEVWATVSLSVYHRPDVSPWFAGNNHRLAW